MPAAKFLFPFRKDLFSSRRFLASNCSSPPSSRPSLLTTHVAAVHRTCGRRRRYGFRSVVVLFYTPHSYNNQYEYIHCIIPILMLMGRAAVVHCSAAPRGRRHRNPFAHFRIHIFFWSSSFIPPPPLGLQSRMFICSSPPRPLQRPRLHCRHCWWSFLFKHFWRQILTSNILRPQ